MTMSKCLEDGQMKKVIYFIFYCAFGGYEDFYFYFYKIISMFYTSC